MLSRAKHGTRRIPARARPAIAEALGLPESMLFAERPRQEKERSA